MAAQRLGSILTNVTGTSKQVLRVNAAETGFEFVSTGSLPTYTITNDTTDRIIDANDVTLDKFSDVLCTTIKDIGTVYSGGGVSTFQWSTSEQVWPFEKASGGATLYCKEVNFGTLPNATTKNVAHGISNFNAGDDLFFMNVIRKVSTTRYIQIPCPRPDNMAYQAYAGVDSTNINIWNGYDMSSDTAIVRLIYKKSG
jgi:hypothetical protein